MQMKRHLRPKLVSHQLTGLSFRRHTNTRFEKETGGTAPCENLINLSSETKSRSVAMNSTMRILD